MTVVPMVDPVKAPPEEVIVATVVLPLTHVPPVGVALIVNVPPLHTEYGPDITGVGFTVKIVVAEHGVPPPGGGGKV